MATSGRGVMAFAKEGYYIDKDKNIGYPGIPKPLAEEFKNGTKEHCPIIRCIAIGPDDNFFCSWIDADKKPWKWHSLSNYPELKTYLEDTDRKAKFDFAGFNCSLGPNGAFYINNSGSGQYHRKLDPSLQKELDRRVNEEGLWPYDPTHVALGLDGAFVLVGKKGDLFWDLKGKYAFLEKKLQETKQRVKTVTLSPFHEHCYVLWNDGSSSYWAPENWDLSVR